MDFFIANAYAQTGAGPAGPGMGDLVFLVILFVVFYFILIRPQQKRAKEHKQMAAGLSKGDEVVTNGGLLGRITGVDDDFVTLELAKGMEVKVQRQAVSTLMPKGTIKSLAS